MSHYKVANSGKITGKCCAATAARVTYRPKRIKAWSLLVGLLTPVHHALAANEFTLQDAYAFEGVGTATDISGLPLQNGLRITRFYATADPLPAAPAGTLIRKDSTPFQGYAGNSLYGAVSVLPAGVSAYRFVYHSRSSQGEPVASSGVILIPPGEVPAGGWPVIAWAHGSSGVAHHCAPSAMKDLQYGDTGLYGFLDSLYTSPTSTVFPKYAVVATDYTGLGTRYRFEYLSRVARGQDIIYSIRAARKAFPEVLSKRWLVVGHSDGGLGALGVAELESEFRDPNYLGAVAIAPLTYLTATIKATAAGNMGSLVYAAYAVKQAFPEVLYEDLLKPAARRLLNSASALVPPIPVNQTRLGCIYAARASDGFGSYERYQQVLRRQPGKGINHPSLAAFSEQNAPAKTKAYRPLFIIQGLADEVIPPRLTRRAVKNLCRVGDKVYYKTYEQPSPPFSPHTLAVYQSFDDQMEWIGDRFAGVPAPNSCP